MSQPNEEQMQAGRDAYEDAFGDIDAERIARLLAHRESKLLEAIARLTRFAERVRDDWDHDEDAHRYGTSCRCCDADAAVANGAR